MFLLRLATPQLAQLYAERRLIALMKSGAWPGEKVEQDLQNESDLDIWRFPKSMDLHGFILIYLASKENMHDVINLMLTFLMAPCALASKVPSSGSTAKEATGWARNPIDLLSDKEVSDFQPSCVCGAKLPGYVHRHGDLPISFMTVTPDRKAYKLPSSLAFLSTARNLPGTCTET